MAADGTRRVQLTSTAGQDIAPRVTRDGRYIVFVSDRDGGRRPWRMALDGSGATRLTSDTVLRWRIYVSADSKWVYYNNETDESLRVSIDGGSPERVLSDEILKRLNEPPPKGFHEPMMSPDGAFLAGHFSEDSARSERTVLIPIAGGAVRKLATVPSTATWAPDGKSLIYIDTSVGVSNLMRYSISNGSLAALTRFTTDRIFDYDVSPDQKQLAAVRGKVSSDAVLISSGK